VGNKSKLHFWSLGTAIAYCSIGAFLSFNSWTNLKSESLKILEIIFLPSKLIATDSIYGTVSMFALLWHLILLLIAWALFFLAFKLIRILREMK
jgi:hypothetical protein